jgi:hypothetical protein
MTQDEVKQVNLLDAFKITAWHIDMTFGEVEHVRYK